MPDPIAEALRLLAAALESPAGAGTGSHTATVTVTASLGFTAERFAVAPDATRIGVRELSEATGRSRAALYKLVQREGLPCRKLPDKTLAFVLGDVRQWFNEREQIVNAAIPHIGGTRGRRIT